MFQQADSIETSLSTLHLDDHDPVSIDLFLQYLYSDRCLLTEENRAEQLLELADKYHVDSLKLLIEDYFILNKENCLRLFILADRHSAVRLKDSTIKFIHQNLTQVFSKTGTADWTTFRQTFPYLVADLYGKAVNLPAVLMTKK